MSPPHSVSLRRWARCPGPQAAMSEYEPLKTDDEDSAGGPEPEPEPAGEQLPQPQPLLLQVAGKTTAFLPAPHATLVRRFVEEEGPPPPPLRGPVVSVRIFGAREVGRRCRSACFE